MDGVYFLEYLYAKRAKSASSGFNNSSGSVYHDEKPFVSYVRSKTRQTSKSSKRWRRKRRKRKRRRKRNSRNIETATE